MRNKRRVAALVAASERVPALEATVAGLRAELAEARGVTPRLATQVVVQRDAAPAALDSFISVKFAMYMTKAERRRGRAGAAELMSRFAADEAALLTRALKESQHGAMGEETERALLKSAQGSWGVQGRDWVMDSGGGGGGGEDRIQAIQEAMEDDFKAA
jgi:hypothetical protein